MKMYTTTLRLDSNTKKNADRMTDMYSISLSALLKLLINSAAMKGVVLPGVTENGLTTEVEEGILKAHKEGGYTEFESVSDMIKQANEAT